MSDERLTDLLGTVSQPTEPDPAFLERLYGELAEELGFRERRAEVALRPRRTARWWLLVAAVLVLGLVGSALVAGAAIRLLEEQPAPDVLDAIRQEGVLRVAVRDGFPQARSPEGAFGGFDVDVANELASRLGVRSELQPIRTGTISPTEDWQLSLVSDEAVTGPPGTAASVPIYYWPVHVIVPADSAIGTMGELDGTDICVVSGSSGEVWLGDETAVPSGTSIIEPPDAAAVVRPDDESCLDALVDGSVIAAVTADLGPAELAVRGAIRALDGPVFTEERVALVDADSGDVAALLDAVDAAIEAARADGTLSDLARSRFGGHDLSVPPSRTVQED